MSLHIRKKLITGIIGILVPTMVLGGWLFIHNNQAKAASQSKVINAAFDQASHESGVPVALLKAICYTEGHLSNHHGQSSIDGGYGCMHLIEATPQTTLPKGSGKDQNIGTNHTHKGQANLLAQAAKDLGVTTDQLKTDIATNIRGGAAILRDEALQLSPDHTLPSSLSDWYPIVATYSNATSQSTANLYADSVYSLINNGFSASAENSETVALSSQPVQPNKTKTNTIKNTTTTLPAGCVDDGKTDYPGAIDCIVDPTIFDCVSTPDDAPCTFEVRNRPEDYPVNYVVIHDIEGTALNALNVFQDVTSGVSIHYIVDTDGTVYQVVHDKDIAYQAGNYWYNQRSIGIEHAGYDATGFLWYNATEYLASAKLTAYLLKKYNIPLDHDHVISHGIIPSPTLGTSPNHVDPGPYWLWDYYLEQIHKQGIAYSSAKSHKAHILTLKPQTDKKPAGKGGTETASNFNFFYLYNGPGTKSGLLPGNGSDITIENNNVEPMLSYYYVAKMKDPDGSGNMLYEICYGSSDHLSDSPFSSYNYFTDGLLAWLSVPSNAVEEGSGTIITLNQSGASAADIYGRPVSSANYITGNAPTNAVFASPMTVVESSTGTVWYSINYNHRQAWVPASEVSTIQA
jgi:N-acetyl-anhydromuramyl-L-alanine amidase AmpD